MRNFLQLFVHNPPTAISTNENFLQYFLVILKHSENLQEKNTRYYIDSDLINSFKSSIKHRYVIHSERTSIIQETGLIINTRLRMY